MATQINSTAQKRPKWVKRLVILGALVVVYTITGFFIVPAIIKSQMLKRIPALTHREASIESVKVNPYALSLTLNNFSLKDPDGETFVGFDRVYVNFQLSSIFKRCWVFDEISVDAPLIPATYLTNGKFNFSDLLTNLMAAAPVPKPAALKIFRAPARPEKFSTSSLPMARWLSPTEPAIRPSRRGISPLTSISPASLPSFMTPTAPISFRAATLARVSPGKAASM